MITQKNIFLSCSYTIPNGLTVFDGEKRFFQLLETIESCKRIPDSINIISEGSMLKEDMLNELQSKAKVFLYPIDELNIHKNKSYGSLLLWLHALDNLEIAKDSNVFFLSGRYRLTDSFTVNDFQADYVFKNHWFSPQRGGWYGTQLFMVSGKKIETFRNLLEYSKKYIHSFDIECSLYRSFYDLRIPVTEIPLVNCIGELGPTGQVSLH